MSDSQSFPGSRRTAMLGDVVDIELKGLELLWICILLVAFWLVYVFYS